MAKTDKNNEDGQRILTPEFRVSYPHVFKPNAMKGEPEEKAKYSVTMLFPKTSDLSTLKLAIKHAKIAEFGPDKTKWPDDLESPVKDGDLPKFADKEGYKGHWIIKASSNRDPRPGVVDYPAADDIVNQEEFYAGCFARAQVFARVYEFAGKQGVHFILDHVQKTKEGKPFSSKKSAKDVFNPGGAKKAAQVDDEDEEDFT